MSCNLLLQIFVLIIYKANKMECRSWPKLLVIIILLVFLSGNTICQNIEVPFKADSIACDTFPPPLWLDAMISNYVVHLWWLAPELEITDSYNYLLDAIRPENLLRYNLYLNEEFIDSISYCCEDTSHYYDTMDIWYPPGYIEYHVSAVYDLAPCGFADSTAESSLEGPLSIGFPEAFILAFIEDWNTASFYPNHWIADEYWYADGPYGHPPPCATYSNFPDSAYQQSLVSWWIDCMNQPTGDTTYVIGDFYLEFEIKLNHLPMSGTDYLDVKISDSLNWHVVEQFSTESGSFGWELHTINITEWAKGNLVRINFTAHGEDGANIQDWYLDNIRVYRKCNPPRDLHWVVFDEVMAWSPPLPHTTDKGTPVKELQGYRVYYNITPLAITTDTFHIIDTPFGYGPYYVLAVYEDCEPVSNYIYGPQQIEENKTDPEINIYPNPADEQITISAQKFISSVKIYDVHGEQLIRSEPHKKQCIIDTQGIADGIYIIQLSIGNDNVSRKIIIQH